MSACRSCGARIVWATTERGKAIPLDAEPSERGNLVLDGGTARVVDMLSPPGPRYLSHFITCPDAASHRRRP